MKRYGKRIVSAVLVMALLITLLSALTEGNSYYAVASEQSVRLDQSERYRGVVDTFDEVPSKGNVLGSPEYPFLVLEIVPYEEYAEFGYLISGCEPVNIHDIFIDRNEKVISTLMRLNTADIKSLGTVYFFRGEDEEYNDFVDAEGNLLDSLDGVSFYYNSGNTDSNKVYGYFQKVAPGTGDWIIIRSEDSVTSGDAGSGTVSGNTADDTTGGADVDGTVGGADVDGTVGDAQTDGAGDETNTDDKAGDTQAGSAGYETDTDDKAGDTQAGSAGDDVDAGGTVGDIDTDDTGDNIDTDDAGDDAQTGDVRDSADADGSGDGTDTKDSRTGQNTEPGTENLESGQDTATGTVTNMTSETGDTEQGETRVQSEPVLETAMSVKSSRLVLTNSEGVDLPENEPTAETDNNGDADSGEDNNGAANTGNLNGGTGEDSLPEEERDVEEGSGIAGGTSTDGESGTVGDHGITDGSGIVDESGITDGSNIVDEPGTVDEGPADSGEVIPGEETNDANELLMPMASSGEFPFKWVGSGEGDWIWHSFSDEKYEEHKDLFIDPSKLVPNDIIGDEYVYTWRIPMNNECIQVKGYYTYKNNDLFLQYTLKPALGLSDDEVEDYSIVVKTITPGELNATPAWIDRANLIYLSSASHKSSGEGDQKKDHDDTELAKIWGTDGKGNGYGYGWLFRESSESSHPNTHTHLYTGKKDVTYNGNDLTWATTEKLYRKVANQPLDPYGGEWKPDYAALIMDDSIYNPDSGLFNGTTSDVTINVYDWNFNKVNLTTPKVKGSNNNIYKLGTMLMAMDTSLFTNLYLNPVNGNGSAYISGSADGLTGVIADTLQAGSAQTYWSVRTFFLVATYWEADHSSLDDYWKNELWNYHSTTAPTAPEYRYWVNDHVFTCPGDKGILADFDKSYANDFKGINANEYTQLFSEYCNSLPAGTEQWTAANAVGYILRDIQKNRIEQKEMTEAAKKAEEERTTVHVLDLEPSVGLPLNKNGQPTSGTPQWFMKESYVQMMLGGYDGNIDITHQTTAEFIGKTEDLVNDYQLIYLGLDVSGYNTDNINVTLNNNRSVSMHVPTWNDGNLGNRIYTHSGDVLQYKEVSTNTRYNMNWVWTGVGQNKIAGDVWDVRFPGNDISHRKMLELEEFLAAGHPVVAERYLYNLEEKLIDKTSYIYQLVCLYKNERGNWNMSNNDRPGFVCKDCSEGQPHQKNTSIAYWSKVYSTANVVSVSSAMDFRNKVEFTSLPKEYPEYLDAIGGSVRLPFVWTINDSNTDWEYRIYVDMNGDLKFGESEVVTEGFAYTERANDRYALLSSAVPGPVQWKIEVYRSSNPAERYVEFGFSAIPADQTTDGKREVINVLQIMPNEKGPAKDNTGYLNMMSSGFQKNYLSGLKDYEVNIDATWYEAYVGLFKNNVFKYDPSTGKINDGWNDYVTIKRYNGTKEDTIKKHLMDYDVIIVGFEDSSGVWDLLDINGAVQFLWYWADSGRGILFTHDLSSMLISEYNSNVAEYVDKSTDPSKNYGNTVSNLLRDVMGMNRYGAISIHAGNDRIKKLSDYQNAKKSQGLYYDWVVNGEGGRGVGTQGYTYVAMFMYASGNHVAVEGYENRKKNSNVQLFSDDERSKYKKMMLYKGLPEKVFPRTSSTNNGITQWTERPDLNLNHWYSKTVSQVNVGQVTVYPYNIELAKNPDNGRMEMEVAQTHTQYYQLNPEDEDVIVWYALSQNTEKGDGQNKKSESMPEGDYYTYEVSPNDAMNNYYIYSKKNVFYSGVGHDTPNAEEQKLLVNVMIAAYKAGQSTQSYVEIENAEMIKAESGVHRAYEISQVQNYEGSSLAEDFLFNLAEEEIDPAPLEITFTPKDFNPYAKNLECVIVYEYKDKNGHTHIEDITKLLKSDVESDYGEISKVKGKGSGSVDPSDPGPKQGLVIGTGKDKIEVANVFRFQNKEDYRLSLDRKILYKIIPKKVEGTETAGNLVDLDSRWIIFYLRNDVKPEIWTKTKLDISILPLFLLE